MSYVSKTMYQVVQLLTVADYPGSNLEEIKVRLEPCPNINSGGEVPVEIGDHLTYDKFGGKHLRVMEIAKDIFTLKIVTENEQDYVPHTFLNKGIKYFVP